MADGLTGEIATQIIVNSSADLAPVPILRMAGRIVKEISSKTSSVNKSTVVRLNRIFTA